MPGGTTDRLTVTGIPGGRHTDSKFSASMFYTHVTLLTGVTTVLITTVEYMIALLGSKV